MKKLTTRCDTIESVLNKHSTEIYSLCENRNQFNQLHDMIISILDAPELKNNLAIPKTKYIFNDLKRKNNFNAYISTITTYITGMRV